MSLILLALLVLSLVILFVPAVRRAGARHRVRYALLSPPLLPFLGVITLNLFNGGFNGELLAVLLVSYAAGLVAFFFVVTVRDGRR
jgi:hypothetical protein